MKTKTIMLLLLLTFGVLLGREAQAYYNPSTGRWLNRDPLGEPGFELLRRGRPDVLGDGPNLYQFVRNDPIRRYDSLGLRDPGVPGPGMFLIPGGIGVLLDVFAMSRGCDTIGPGEEAFGRTPSSQLAYFSWIAQATAQLACNGSNYEFRTRVYKDDCGTCHYGGLYIICLGSSGGGA